MAEIVPLSQATVPWFVTVVLFILLSPAPPAINRVLLGAMLTEVALFQSPACQVKAPLMTLFPTRLPESSHVFVPVTVPGVQLSFRTVGGRQPGTLEIALHGKRRPRVEAYWDGCLMAMD